MGQKKVINRLIGKYFTNTITESEKLILESWRLDHPRNNKEFADFEYIWKESEKLSGSAAQPEYLSFDKFPRRKYVGFLRYAIEAAAVIVLSIILYSVFPSRQNETFPITHNRVFHETKAAYGTQTKVTLADGSIVHLNSGSTLRYPLTFDGMDSRKVYLEGEGYFTIESIDDVPFIVDLNSIQVRVTGTRFNVNHYKRSGQFSVALLEGSVIIQRENAKIVEELCTLEAGDFAMLNPDLNQLNIIRQNSLERHLSWIEGIIVFENDPIQMVAERLSAWYNVDIEIADTQLSRYRFTGTFINEPLEQILLLLSKTSPMSYTLMPSVKMDDNSYTKRQIVLKSKN